MACGFDAELLAAYIDQLPVGTSSEPPPDTPLALSAEETAQVYRHLTGCEECRETVVYSLAQRLVAAGATHDCSEWQHEGQCALCGRRPS